VGHDRAPEARPLTAPAPGGERLQKLLARAGFGSRRSCETLISEGRVTIDGRVATLGERADPATQRVELDGQPIRLPTDELSIVLNKPPGYVVSVAVEPTQHSVYELLSDAPPNLRYVGRLDSDTEGVLLFTTLGELVHRLTHPRYEIDKVYETTVEGSPSDEKLDQLRAGVELEDGWTSPAQVELVEMRGHETVLKLVIHEGRKRQIRRMCRAIGHPVRRLRRTAFGPITLQGIAPGESRELTAEELVELARLAQLTPDAVTSGDR
jgi:pseudouridine synthase